MIEPLVAVARNRLLFCRASVSVMQRSKGTRAGDASRPANPSSFPAHFFTPHARPWKDKGKGKAQDAVDIECRQCLQHPVRCGEAPCIMRHSIWCPKRTRLLMMKEVFPCRTRTSRRNSSHISIRRHAYSIHSLSVALSQTKHAFSASNLPPPPAKAPSWSPILAMRALLTRSEEGLNLDEAWSVFDSLNKLNQLDSLTPKEVLIFAKKITKGILQFGDLEPEARLEFLHKQGGQLEELLERVGTRLLPLSSLDLSKRCLMVSALAFCGDFEQAISVLDSVRKSPVDDSVQAGILLSHASFIYSLDVHRGGTEVLDFLTRHWTFVSPYLQPPSRRLQHKDQLTESHFFRQTAYRILANIPDPAALLANRQTWDAGFKTRIGVFLIEVYCHEDLAHDAYATFQEMRRQNLDVPLSSQLTMVKALARADLFARANELFDALSSASGKKSRYQLSTGLYLFGHQGDVARAEDHFASLKKAGQVNVSDMAMLMQAYAVSGKVEKVVALFHQFFPDNAPRRHLPNIIHYTILILAHARRGDTDGLNFWLADMSKHGIHPDVYVYNVIVKSFAARGEVDSVAAVLDQMHAARVRPNRAVYTSVILLLAQRKDAVAAEAIYKRALQERIEPDRKMVTALMNAHVEAGSWKGAIRVFDYLRSSRSPRIKLSIEVYNVLMKAYVLIGSPYHVVSALFDRVRKSGLRPDVHTYALLIQSACDAGLMDTATSLFKEMEQEERHWETHLNIDAFVLTILMAGHLRQHDKARAKAVYDSMRDRGIQATSMTFSHILRAYANEKNVDNLQLAEDFLHNLVDAENKSKPARWMIGSSRQAALESVYRPLMRVYTRELQPEEVERLFRGMLHAGGKPSLGTLTTLLDAYRRRGDIHSVQEIWPQIWQLALRQSNFDSLFKDDSSDPYYDPMKRHNGNLLCVPLSIYIDALSAAGEHLIIAEVWAKARSQGFSFDSHNWNHLTVALVRAGEPERAFEVIERVILPYQRQAQPLTARDSDPITPLSFDVEDPSVDSPPDGSPMYSSERRASSMTLNTNNSQAVLALGEDTDDPALALHILHQLSPSWNVWKPHNITLDVLLSVISRLQAGMTIRPVVPPGKRATSAEGDDDENENDFDNLSSKASARAELARDVLNRIYSNYPQAVQAVLSHARMQFRREARTVSRSGRWS